MKAFKFLSVMGLCLCLLLGTTSCMVRPKTDNGKHKGWHKNSNNPHGNHSPKPGKSHGRSKR